MATIQLYDKDGNEVNAISSFDAVINDDGDTLQEKFDADEIPLTMLPDNLYAITGRLQWFYYNKLFVGMESSYGNTLTNYRFVIKIRTSSDSSAASIGSFSDEGFCVFTDTADDYAVTIYVYNTNLRLLGSYTTTLHVMDAVSSSGKNILYFGDSLLDPSIPIAASVPEAGVAVQTYYALQEMGIEANFVGTKDCGVDDISVYCEGRGGYDWDTYATEPSYQSFKFYYSSGTIEIGDVYADDDGSTFTVYEVGDGYTSTYLTSGTAPTGSTLTLQSGGGSDTIEFTSFTQTGGNPLWNPDTNEVDATYYREQILGMTDNFDIIVINLGANYCLGSVNTDDENETQWGYAETIINAFLADSPDCKIIVSSQSFGAPTLCPWSENYGISIQKVAYEINAYNLQTKLLSEITSRDDYLTNVFIGDGVLGMNGWVGNQYYDARKIYLQLDESTSDEDIEILKANTYTYYTIQSGFAVKALYYDERGYLVCSRFLGTAWTYRDQEFVDSRSEPIDSYWVRDLLPSSGTATADANTDFVVTFTDLKIENNPLAAHHFINALHPSSYGNRMRSLGDAAQIACLLAE